VEKTINWPKVKKIAGIVGNVILWIFVAFSVLMTVLVFSAQGSEDGVPSLFGKGIITIESPSMEPVYYEGDLVYVTKLDLTEKSNLANGTIITYRVDLNNDGIEELNTHRIIAKDEYGFYITQGDNNDLADNVGDNAYKVHPQTVVGTCTEDGKLSGVGNVIKFLRSSLGFFLCIVLPLILFFLYELYNFITILVSERAKKKGAEVSKETEEEIKRRAIEEYLKAQAEANATEDKADEDK
jgi:signal peptidase